MDAAIPEELFRQGRKKRHVASCEMGGRKVWIKKRRRNKNPLGWWAQRLLHGATGMLLLLPPARPAGDNVRFESEKLRRVAALGMRVPEVLRVEADCFVMADTGLTLEKTLKCGGDRGLVAKAARELRRLHDMGEAHGGAQIKNMTVSGGEIYFIDFEENIPEGELKRFQLRDVFLFLLSLERSGFDPDLPALCRVYDDIGDDNGDGDDGGATWSALRPAIRQLWPVRLFDLKFFANLSMRDIRSLRRLLEKAR